MAWFDQWRSRAGRRPRRPDPEARAWVHPSELPSFTALPSSALEPRHSRLARLLASLGLLALLAGSAALASTHHATPASQSMSTTVTTRLSALPAYARAAAARTVDLTIAIPGHDLYVPAMVLSPRLAVTTVSIPSDAILTASVPGHLNFPVTWVGRDATMGFTVVRLGLRMDPLVFAPLPASTSIMAIAPVERTSISRPRFAWANTTLGDPVLRANGVVSYLATPPRPNLHGVADAIGVDAHGHVVAVLSAGGEWYSAQFVARVATVLADGQGCHASLDLVGETAQGGGAQITAVDPEGVAVHHLRRGDIILTLNHHPIDSWDALLTVLYLTPAHDPARVTFLRGTVTRHTTIVLGCALSALWRP